MGPILRAGLLVLALLTIVYFVITGIERVLMRGWYRAEWRRGDRSQPQEEWVAARMQDFERRVRRQRIFVFYVFPIGLLALLVLFLRWS